MNSSDEIRFDIGMSGYSYGTSPSLELRKYANGYNSEARLYVDSEYCGIRMYGYRSAGVDELLIMGGRYNIKINEEGILAFYSWNGDYEQKWLFQY